MVSLCTRPGCINFLTTTSGVQPGAPGGSDVGEERVTDGVAQHHRDVVVTRGRTGAESHTGDHYDSMYPSFRGHWLEVLPASVRSAESFGYSRKHVTRSGAFASTVERNVSESPNNVRKYVVAPTPTRTTTIPKL